MLVIALLHHFRFRWLLLMVPSIRLHWIGSLTNEITFYQFRRWVAYLFPSNGKFCTRWKLYDLFEQICLTFNDSITRFYFIFIFREDEYRRDGRNWGRQEMVRKTSPQFEIVILCSGGLLLVLGTGFAVGLGAIALHEALEKTKQMRDRG